MSRKRQQPRKPYQRRPGSSTSFVQLHHDLMDSKAFHDLSARAKVLYLYCVRESHGAATRDDVERHDERLLYMNKALRTQLHELYPPSDTRMFEEHMSELIGHGFIDVAYRGYKSRERSVYRLSSRWCDWGTDKFEVPDSVKSSHMLMSERSGDA